MGRSMLVLRLPLCLATLHIALACSILLSDDEVTVTGIVNVMTDEDGNITAIKVFTGEDLYNIVLDANGKRLAKEMEAKMARVTGIVVTKREDEMWLKATKWTEVGPGKEE